MPTNARSAAQARVARRRHQIDIGTQCHQMCAQHHVQLAGMAKGELPQQGFDRRRRITPPNRVFIPCCVAR